MLDTSNPIDLFEEIASAHEWSYDRSNAHEVAVEISGAWCDYRIIASWRDEMCALHFACAFDMRIPDRRRSEVNQLLAGVHIAAACEAVTFAKKLGLDLPTVYKVITASAGNSWMFENRVPHILDGDYAPRSAVEIFTKDLGIVSDMGRHEKFPLQIAATALQMFLMTAAAGMERDDDASVARMIAEVTGLELPVTSLANT